MGRGATALAVMAFGCSPLHRVPAPEPPQTTRPPTNARAHYLRAQVLQASGRVDEAVNGLERARLFDPGSARIVVALSEAVLTRGEAGRARGLAKAATEVAPDDPTTWSHYGRLELAFGDRVEGRNALERALELGADWRVRAKLIRDDLQQAGSSRLLDEWQVSTIDEQRHRGELRLAAGDPSGALADLLAVIPERGRDLALVTPVVQSAVAAGQIPDTLLALDALTSRQPGDSAALISLGLLNSHCEDSEGTIVALRGAVSAGVTLGPRPEAALRKAEASLGLGEVGPAASPEEKGLAEAALTLWAAVMTEGGGDLVHVEHRLMTALRRQPRDGRLWSALGQLISLNGDHQRAKHALSRALRLDSQQAAARKTLAEIEGME